MLIYIHGISGVGKSFIGNKLQQNLKNSIVIDQDSYYKPNKPTISFTNDNGFIYTASNWDTDDAIDYEQFNLAIINAINQYDYVIVTGFSLKSSLMLLKPAYSFLLYFNMNDKQIQEKMIESRLQSKGFQGEKAEKDKWMVRKVVFPYYQETLKNIEYDYKLPVFINEQRVEGKLILQFIYDILDI